MALSLGWDDDLNRCITFRDHLKVGDEVAVSSGLATCRYRFGRVVRTTKTQVVVGFGDLEFETFLRSTGKKVGSGGSYYEPRLDCDVETARALAARDKAADEQRRECQAILQDLAALTTGWDETTGDKLRALAARVDAHVKGK